MQIYGHQITPGIDDLIYFATTREACESAAREHRECLKRDPEYSDFAPMGLYLYTLKPLDVETIVAVLNDEMDLIRVATTARKFVGWID